MQAAVVSDTRATCRWCLVSSQLSSSHFANAQEVAETLADTRAALALVRRELPLSPPRVVCRLSVAATGCGAPHVTVHLLPDRYCAVMTTVVQVGTLQPWCQYMHCSLVGVQLF